MIAKQINPTTGQPMVREHRSLTTQFHALPRQYFEWTYGSPARVGKPAVAPQQKWIAHWQDWDGLSLQRLRCWKCGVDVKGWRVAMDPRGNPIKVNNQPAVSFQLLNHFRQTPMQAHLPAVGSRVTFSVLHCADCVIRNDHAMEALTCYLQGLDAQLQRAWRYSQGQQLSRDEWASYLYVWADAEPVGMPKTMSLDERLANLNRDLLELRQEEGIRLPTPGEILTAAQYVLDAFSWRYTGIPAGIRVKYEGEPPPGWIRVAPGPVDPVKYPRLAEATPFLPNAPDEIVKL